MAVVCSVFIFLKHFLMTEQVINKTLYKLLSQNTPSSTVLPWLKTLPDTYVHVHEQIFALTLQEAFFFFF